MYITKDTKVVVQGITGKQGSFHTKLMLDYGTKIVAGVTPKKGGQEVHGVPVYNTVADATQEHDIDASIIFVPARFCYSAIKESLDANISTIVVITENIPVLDTLRVVQEAIKKGIHIVGPNTPGMMVPENIKLGIMPSDLAHYGNVGVVTKSGTLSYEIVKSLDVNGIGVSSYVGIGGDPVRGTSFVEALEFFEKDPQTKAVVLIGEIGGDEEERAAEFIKDMSKPIFAYIAGKSAPKGKRMGHAGAIISGDFGTAQGKIKALTEVGATVAEKPWDLADLIKDSL